MTRRIVVRAASRPWGTVMPRVVRRNTPPASAECLRATDTSHLATPCRTFAGPCRSRVARGPRVAQGRRRSSRTHCCCPKSCSLSKPGPTPKVSGRKENVAAGRRLGHWVDGEATKQPTTAGPTNEGADGRIKILVLLIEGRGSNEQFGSTSLHVQYDHTKADKV